MEHNLRLLQEEIRKAGFGDPVREELEKKARLVKEQAFYIPFAAKVDGRPVKGELYLERESLQRDLVWRHFTLDLGKDSTAYFKENKFLVSYGYATSLREAYNLMHGRYIYREPEFDRDRRSYWASLDFGRQIAGYTRLDFFASDFKMNQAILDSSLNKYLIPPQKIALAAALEQGDRKGLELSVMGVSKKVWAEASPVFKKIRLSDARDKTIELPDLGRDRHREEKLTRSKGRHR